MKQIGVLSAILLPGIALLSSCTEKKADFIGEWRAVKPVSVTSEITGAESATEE